MNFGIVENNDDSANPDGLRLGRCQVRVFGKHTDNRITVDDFEYLPTSDLPWFEIMLPTTSAGQQYNYETPFIKNGSTVSIEYTDIDQQHGVIIGVLLRQPIILPDFDKGFTDPNAVYPTSPDLNKSPLYPYATGELNSIVQNKISGVATSSLGFTEPITPYDPTYTENKVISTKNHFIELDDTNGKERVHIYHKSGTFTEIHPNGTKVTNVKNTQYHIIVGDDNTKIDGIHNLEVNGNINIKTNSTINIMAANDAIVTAGGNITATASGNVDAEGTIVTLTGDSIKLESPLISFGVNGTIGQMANGALAIATDVNILNDNISLHDHVHGGVTIGSGNTQSPV